jgi:hypothetical protein
LITLELIVNIIIRYKPSIKISFLKLGHDFFIGHPKLGGFKLKMLYFRLLEKNE